MHPLTNSMERVDDDEKKLAEIHKHPLGIIFLYIQATIGLIVAVGLAYFLLPVVVTNTDDAFFYGNLFAAVSVTLAFIVILIATFIYRQNRLILTDRNLTQTLQYGLFNRKVSQLNMTNVEDVTAIQNGILSTVFNVGTLKIETAGEQMNFNFSFCPNPGYYAKIILDARECMLGQMEGASQSQGAPKTTASVSTNTAPDLSAIKELGAETLKQAQQ